MLGRRRSDKGDGRGLPHRREVAVGRGAVGVVGDGLRGGHHEMDGGAVGEATKDLAGLANPPGLRVKQAKNCAQICDYARATDLAPCRTLAERAGLAANAHIARLYDNKSAEECFALLLNNL